MNAQEIITQILLNYGPMLAGVGTFIGFGIKFLKGLATILSKSNLDEVKQEIQAHQDEMAEDIINIKALANELAQQNRELRKQNNELLTELTKVVHE